MPGVSACEFIPTFAVHLSALFCVTCSLGVHAMRARLLVWLWIFCEYVSLYHKVFF